MSKGWLNFLNLETGIVCVCKISSVSKKIFINKNVFSEVLKWNYNKIILVLQSFQKYYESFSIFLTFNITTKIELFISCHNYINRKINQLWVLHRLAALWWNGISNNSKTQRMNVKNNRFSFNLEIHTRSPSLPLFIFPILSQSAYYLFYPLTPLIVHLSFCPIFLSYLYHMRKKTVVL